MSAEPDLPPIRGWKSREFVLADSVELSHKQAAAVVAGLELGFFDVPKTGTCDDLAAVLGITNGPASHRLRVAEHRLFSHFAPQLREQLPEDERPVLGPDPGLASLANKLGVSVEEQDELAAARERARPSFPAGGGR